MKLAIGSAFEGGNIEVRRLNGPDAIELALLPDAGGEFRQWFSFRVTGCAGVPLTIRIVDLEGSAYPYGWPGYRARVSEDRVHWRQADTVYAEGTMIIRVAPAGGALWVAYFAPYTMERHHDLVARIAARPGVTLRALGRSLDGQDIDCLTLGNGSKQAWLYCRQHPGESMTEWWAEGALDCLTDPADPVARALLARFTIHVVPNMNPDGTRRGYLRTNAAGANLNREWHAPTLERAPEVKAVLDAMIASGVDFAFDVHGDEAIPHVFIAGFEGIPSLRDQQLAGYNAFKAALAARTPDFQTARGYPVTPAGQANLTMSTNAVAERFGCVSATLEMPFKDHDDLPDPKYGWSPARSMGLGRDCLGALLDIADRL